MIILNTIAEGLNKENDLSQALQNMLSLVVDLFELKTGWVWLLREENGESYLAAAQNLPPALSNNPKKMEGSCHCLNTFREGDMEGAANVNVIECSRLSGLVDGTDGLRFHSSIPIYAHRKKLGVLNVASSAWREISEDDLRLLYTIGDLAGIAIERARLFSRSSENGALEERNRLAREIHDTLAQGLTAITLQLETAEALLDSKTDYEHARESVHSALSLARQNLDEARRSVMDLRAVPLEGRSLAQALGNMVERQAGAHGPEVVFEVAGANQPVPIRVESGLYRIAHEAFTNVLKHAQAENVAIALQVSPQEVTLEIRDDGIGFVPEKDTQGRFGLVGLNERVHLLGGTLELQTEPDEGTFMRVIVPLERRS